MIKIVYLLGTKHSVQLGKESAQVTQAYGLLIESIIDAYNVEGVAEEMSDEVSSASPSGQTIGLGIAQARRIAHRNCDLSSREREELPASQVTPNDEQCDPELGFHERIQRQISRQAAELVKEREKSWADQINDFDRWPLLFICGANHVGTFGALLETRGYAVFKWPKYTPGDREHGTLDEEQNSDGS